MIKRPKGKRIGRTALALAVLLLGIWAAAAPLEAGVCEKALGKCLIDAGLPTLASLAATGGIGLIMAVVLAQFCLNGYYFCQCFVVL